MACFVGTVAANTGSATTTATVGFQPKALVVWAWGEVTWL